MARQHANNGRIYRAVIKRTYADGRTSTRMFGPYDTPAPAKGLITQAHTYAGNATVEGHIESAEVVWMREVQ